MPTRRHYKQRIGRRKDVDQAARSLLLTKLALSLPGGVIGALAGWFVGFGFIPGFLIGAALVFSLTTFAERRAASVMGKIYNPSGESTPRRREYSYAESLEIRGRYDEAVEAYEVALSEFPEEPEPYLRIARIYRDRTRDYDNAVYWFKRARSDATVDGGMDQAVTREIIDLYTSRSGQPERAIPELARLADRFAGQPVADWAKQEIKRRREELDVTD